MGAELLFTPVPGRKARAAILMSGAGSNAEVLIRYCREHEGTAFLPVVLGTDHPAGSRTAELGAAYGIPVAALDIREFYRRHGEAGIALTTPRRRELRDQWSRELKLALEPYAIDFVILAGFVPLTNLAGEYACLNVHPGDLTVEENGRRILAGLHWRPIETAILAGHPSLRSSVILAQPYRQDGNSEMDSGPILGISPAVPIDLEGVSLEALRAAAARRESGVPHRDRLREIAENNLGRLKRQGDHIVLPRAADDFAQGKFATDSGRLLYRQSRAWLPIQTVEYYPTHSHPFFLER